uniref:Uncharacterized protein n=1 Tax=Meloidogyne enterolobii TaxID=390850 RepID=A0A6V7WZF4_MELEN|nr:unnamed protein product [Meloidogyne enterolobii]
MGLDIQLLDYDVMYYNQALIKYKKSINSLKSYGIILCFEADVPKAKDMTTHQFEINLLHDSSETYPDFGATVLRLTFNFEPEEYTSLRENNVTFKEGRNSKLIIRTVGSRNLDLDSTCRNSHKSDWADRCAYKCSNHCCTTFLQY